MEDGETYDIPEIRLQWFKDKLAKLDKRAQKLVGKKIYCTVLGYHFLDGEGDRRLQRMKIYEVFVHHPDVKLNGWEFVARIDHSQETGNVVRIVPGKELPERYRQSSPYCEHCNINRLRRDTFVVNRIGTDEYKQIGTACLRDFLGHTSAAQWAKLAELLAIIGDYSKGYGFYDGGSLNDYRWIDTNEYMAFVAENVMTVGWISQKTATERNTISTANAALLNMGDKERVPSDTHMEMARRAIEWARSFGDDGANMNDWQHNARVIAQSDALEMRHLGIAASIVGVYWSKFEKPQHIAGPISDHVGVVGQKLVRAVTLKIVKATDYSIRHVFEDAHGNVLVWFASKANLQNKIDAELVIEGRVKAHQEYNGVKQTLMNRIKLVG